MTPYWFLFALPLIGLLMPLRLDRNARQFAGLVFGTFIALFVGLRHETGGDWSNYLNIYEDIRDASLSLADALAEAPGDPAYTFLNWLSATLGLGLYGVNFICGLIFVSGFTAFVRVQPFPWLCWLVATPYILIVVVMGYSRQGVALGLLFWALTYLERRRAWRFLFVVLIAALFHKAAILLAPLAFLLRGQRGWLQTAGLLAAVLAAAMGLLASHFEFLWTHYVVDPLVSEGAGIRVWMNAVPAAVMLYFSRKWNRYWPDPGHWRYIAWTSIVCVFFVGVASTAVDRMALYLTPIQIYVWSRFPLLAPGRMERTVSVLGICFVYAAVLWVWLNYATHAPVWIPYRTILSS